MRHTLFLALVLFSAALASCSSRAAETGAAEPPGPEVSFSVRHFFSKVQGRFARVEATVSFDPGDLEKCTAEAVIAVASIDTGNRERDANLQQPEFFDAARFPNITFKSRAWRKTAENEFEVTGDLTIKGVKKPVVFRARAPVPDAAGTTWEATTRINRHDFGVSAYARVIGAEVEATIRLPDGTKP